MTRLTDAEASCRAGRCARGGVGMTGTNQLLTTLAVIWDEAAVNADAVDFLTRIATEADDFGHEIESRGIGASVQAAAGYQITAIVPALGAAERESRAETHGSSSQAGLASFGGAL